MNASTSTGFVPELTSGVANVLRHVRAGVVIDDALEQAVCPDRPARTSDDWLEEIGESLAWATDDLELLEPSTGSGGFAPADARRLAAELDLADPDSVTAAELRTALRWRAQAALIQLASNAARAAATIAEEDALERLRAPGRD